MLHQLLVAVVVHPVEVALHRQPLLQPRPLLLVDAPAQLLVQTVPRLPRHDLRVLVLGQLQNAGAHGGKPLGLLHDGVRIGLPLLRRQVCALQELGEAPYGDEGRFELVGEGVHEVGAQHLHAGQLLRHLVEAADILRHLAPCAAHLHPDGVIPRRHRLRGVHQPGQGSQIPSEYKHRQQHAQNDAHRQQKDGPQQRVALVLQMHQLLHQREYADRQRGIRHHQPQHQQDHGAQQPEGRAFLRRLISAHFRPPAASPYSRTPGWSAAQSPGCPGTYPAAGRYRPPRCARPRRCPDPRCRRSAAAW